MMYYATNFFLNLYFVLHSLNLTHNITGLGTVRHTRAPLYAPCEVIIIMIIMYLATALCFCKRATDYKRTQHHGVKGTKIQLWINRCLPVGNVTGWTFRLQCFKVSRLKMVTTCALQPEPNRSPQPFTGALFLITCTQPRCTYEKV